MKLDQEVVDGAAMVAELRIQLNLVSKCTHVFHVIKIGAQTVSQ